ncbi:MAG: pyridoxal-phosphate dependent enzyme [Dokdonella sp.]
MFPEFVDVERAARRIAPYIAQTPVLHSSSLDALAGAELHFKCENFQRVAAFKFRGASNAVWSLDETLAANGVVTHSSGNHGAALALAARTRGISAHVIVPEGAVPSKVAAIIAFGATVHRCAPTQAARETMADQVAAQTGATMIHPYTNPDVIAGQGTAALELIREHGPFDAIIAPIGGGGLLAGTAVVTRQLLPNASVHGAEPSSADDAARFLAAGQRVDDFTPDTICDGLRALLGEINFRMLQAMRVEILTVTDAETIAAMRLIFERLKIVVEPSCATVLAAVLRHPEPFVGKRVGLILSGGNADLERLPWQS